jgi:hypothetical protein
MEYIIIPSVIHSICTTIQQSGEKIKSIGKVGRNCERDDNDNDNNYMPVNQTPPPLLLLFLLQEPAGIGIAEAV